jgi:hypothetical protein
MFHKINLELKGVGWNKISVVYPYKKFQNRAGGMAEVTKHLANKCKALEFKPHNNICKNEEKAR